MGGLASPAVLPAKAAAGFRDGTDPVCPGLGCAQTLTNITVAIMTKKRLLTRFEKNATGSSILLLRLLWWVQSNENKWKQPTPKI